MRKWWFAPLGIIALPSGGAGSYIIPQPKRVDGIKQNLVRKYYFQMAIPGLFLLCKQLTANTCPFKKLLTAGFKPGSSFVRNDPFANCAVTAAQEYSYTSYGKV